jgi:carbonic anhydrase
MSDQSPARPDEPGTVTALARNRAFAATGGQAGATVFPALRLFVVTCLDPRVDPAQILGLELGDAAVVRNVGGRVTREVVDNIAFICEMVEGFLRDGPLFEVAIIHHNQCGAGALADDDFRRRYGRRTGLDEATLRELAIVDPAATVAEDVERLRTEPAISRRVTVSGYVYDVTTGLVDLVVGGRPAAAATGKA